MYFVGFFLGDVAVVRYLRDIKKKGYFSISSQKIALKIYS